MVVKVTCRRQRHHRARKQRRNTATNISFAVVSPPRPVMPNKQVHIPAPALSPAFATQQTCHRLSRRPKQHQSSRETSRRHTRSQYVFNKIMRVKPLNPPKQKHIARTDVTAVGSIRETGFDFQQTASGRLRVWQMKFGFSGFMVSFVCFFQTASHYSSVNVSS